jgi:hypothetical protein
MTDILESKSPLKLNCIHSVEAAAATAGRAQDIQGDLDEGVSRPWGRPVNID